MAVEQIFKLIIFGLQESLYMLILTSFFSFLLGLALGLILFTSSAQGLKPNKVVYSSLSLLINILRSVPFLILMVYLIPLTRLVAGTSIGSRAAVVPLTISATAFVARLVENALREIPQGTILAAQSMGASSFHILKLLISEAKPALLSAGVLAAINILSYSAMAGFVGGGGLGALAINYGYNRYQTDVMTWTVIVIVVLVQLLEFLGKRLVKKVDQRNN